MKPPAKPWFGEIPKEGRRSGGTELQPAPWRFWRFADARQMQRAMLLMIVHACVEVRYCTEFTCLPVSP